MKTAINLLLKEFGLSEKEVRIYLACLEAGPVAGAIFASHISRKTGLNRSTCYVVLEKLIKYGLVSKSGAEKKFRFSAEKPIRILSLLKERQSKDAILEQKLNQFLPELESLYTKSAELPKIKLLEGIQSIKLVYDDIVNAVPKGGEYFHIGPDMEADIQLMGESWTKKIIEKRVKKGIHSKALLEKTTFTQERKQEDKLEKRQTLFLMPKTKIPVKMHIYENKVAIFSLEEQPSGVLIESKGIAQMMKMFFLSLWSSAKN